jgi:hypothetical protein
MTDESLVINIRRPKRLFTKRDLRRLLGTLPTQDDPIFISERSWTGARLGAIFTGTRGCQNSFYHKI